jgi:hypothetical protein
MADARTRRAAILSEGERSGNLSSILTLGGTTYIPEAQRAAAQSYLDGRFATAAHQTALRGGHPLRVPDARPVAGLPPPDARFGAMTLEDMARAGSLMNAADYIAVDPKDYSSAADPRRPAAGLPTAEHGTYGLETPEMREELATSLSIIRGKEEDSDDDMSGKRKSRKNKTKKGKGKGKGKNKKLSNKSKSSKSRKGSRKNKH